MCAYARVPGCACVCACLPIYIYTLLMMGLMGRMLEGTNIVDEFFVPSKSIDGTLMGRRSFFRCN